MTLKENDPVVIYETGEVGYVEKVLDDLQLDQYRIYNSKSTIVNSP